MFFGIALKRKWPRSHERGHGGESSLGTAEAFAAVQAFVAGAVAHGDLAAGGTARGVLLVGDHLREGGGAARGGFIRRKIHDVGVLGQREFRHRPVHFFFKFLGQAGDGELRLGARAADAFAIARYELEGQPAEDVVGNG